MQDARGDQCDACGKLINATELKVLLYYSCFLHFSRVTHSRYNALRHDGVGNETSKDPARATFQIQNNLAPTLSSFVNDNNININIFIVILSCFV